MQAILHPMDGILLPSCELWTAIPVHGKPLVVECAEAEPAAST
jgi:hypothetical protein